MDRPLRLALIAVFRPIVGILVVITPLVVIMRRAGRLMSGRRARTQRLAEAAQSASVAGGKHA